MKKNDLPFPETCCCGESSWLRYRCRTCGQPFAHWPDSKQVFGFVKNLIVGLVFALVVGLAARGCAG